MMAMPSGRRSSAPSPKPMASGSAPRTAASVVIRIGRKRSRQASRTASTGDRPRERSASSAKSMIRIAFFFTMPISRNSADQRHDREIELEDHQRQHRADAGRGQRRQHRERMHQALVQDAQHDVDDHQRRQDQHRLLALRFLRRARGALEAAAHVVRHRDLGLGRAHRGLAVGQRRGPRPGCTRWWWPAPRPGGSPTRPRAARRSEAIADSGTIATAELLRAEPLAWSRRPGLTPVDARARRRGGGGRRGRGPARRCCRPRQLRAARDRARHGAGRRQVARRHVDVVQRLGAARVARAPRPGSPCTGSARS